MKSSVTLAHLRFSEPDTGELLPSGEGAARTTHLLDLVEELSNRMLRRYWTPRALACLAREVAEDTNPNTRARNRADALGWWLTKREEKPYFVSSRVKRLVVENTIPLLERAVVDDAVLTSLLTVSEGLDRAAARAAAPPGTSAHTLRSLEREYRAFVRREGRPPVSITDLRGPPQAPRKAVLSVVNDQVALHLSQVGDFSMSLRLPVVAVPKRMADYRWLRVDASWPDYLDRRRVAKRHYPDLRVVSGRPVLDVAVTEEVPPEPSPSDRPTRVLGLDWGVTTLWTGALTVRAPDGRVLTDGDSYEFDGGGVVEKDHRLRRHGEHLSAKVARYEALLSGNPDDPNLLRHRLRASTEVERVGAKRRRANRDLAHRAGRFFADLAVKAGVDTIAVEELSSLEAGGLGRALNTRVSQSTRGQCVDAVRHAARREGVRTVEVYARGTSSECPGCGTKLLRSEYRLTKCTACAIITGRDVAAAQRIGSRAHAGRITRDRAKNQVVRKPVHERVSKTREKLGPTPRRHARTTRRVTPFVVVKSAPPARPYRGHRGAGRTSSAERILAQSQGAPNGSPLGPGRRASAPTGPIDS